MAGAAPTRWVALLRGINVGGHRPVPMAELRALVASLGGAGVRTLVQSGNVVFEHARPPAEAAALKDSLQRALQGRFGFEVPVMLRDGAAFAGVAASNPFAAEASDPSRAHVWFLDGPSTDADREGLARLASPTERWHLAEDALYLLAPDGVGRSKFAAGAERLLRVPATARNLNTVAGLCAMLAA